MLGDSTCQSNWFFPLSLLPPVLGDCGFPFDFHVSGLKFQGRIWTKYAFHRGQQFIYLLLMTLYLAAKEI